jgi:uncharacterized membrane protein
MNYWPLLGVGVVVAGFALRWNPVAVVVAAGLTSGFAAGKSFAELLALLGESFVSQRALMLVLLTLPVIGVLEWGGLREQARRWITGFRGVNLAKLLIGYLGLRQAFAMLGLTSIGGHAQTVRPLVAPMAEAAVEQSTGPMPPPQRQKVLALTAATDNVGLFFGEDVFLAFGGVLLIQGFLAQNGIDLPPMQIAIWALPTAIAAFVIHATRLWLYQKRLHADAARATGAGHDAP